MVPPPAVNAAATDSLGLSATYDVSANLQWSNRRLVVVSTATVKNTTASSVSSLTFNLVPAKIGRINMNGVTVNGSAVADSTVTVTASGSAAGDVDGVEFGRMSPRWVNKGDSIGFVSGGESSTTAVAAFSAAIRT